MPILKFELGKYLDPNMVDRVEAIFDGENIVEMILHAHLLIERALTAKIAEKMARPTVLEEFNWSFSQKISLYVGLYGPTAENEKTLRGFNRLRNGIAHEFPDLEQLVRKNLPWDGWDGEKITAPPEPIQHVRVVAMIILFELGAVRAAYRADSCFAPDQEDSN
jgi:hypothetical protein